MREQDSASATSRRSASPFQAHASVSVCTRSGNYSRSSFVTRWTGAGGAGEILRESLMIGGWVAMWRPLEIFLSDWWPIRADGRLFDRLATMPVRVETYDAAPSPDGEAGVVPVVRR